MKNKTLLNLMLTFANIGMVLVILASAIIFTVLIISYFNPAFKPSLQIGSFNYVPTTEFSGEYVTSHSRLPLAVDSITVKFKGFYPEPTPERLCHLFS